MLLLFIPAVVFIVIAALSVGDTTRKARGLVKPGVVGVKKPAGNLNRIDPTMHTVNGVRERKIRQTVIITLMIVSCFD